MESSTARVLPGGRAVEVAARVGLAARGVLYLLLAGLALGLLTGHRSAEHQANANGALAEVVATGPGWFLLAGAGLGFVGLGVTRLIGAWTDHRPGRLRRLSTAGQGAMYLGLAWATASFLAGHRATGSEEQQHRMTGSVLALPGGRLLVVVGGLLALAVCGWQLVVAVLGRFEDTLRTQEMSPPVRTITTLTGRIGIPARALAVAPIAIFLVVAGLQSDQGRAAGLDGMLLQLMPTAWGRTAVALIAVGFLVFAVYSFLEARFRDVASGA